MDKIYDLIIVGAGPAGITAGIYAARSRLDFIMVSKDLGGQAAWTNAIENYTGQPLISGQELAAKFSQHINQYKIDLKLPEAVEKLELIDPGFAVVTKKTTYLAKTIIIASGKRPKELMVAGEREFKNRGVTYCPICDGPLFKDKNVAVVGGGNSALEAALGLAKICVKVYLVNINPQLAGEAVLIERLNNLANVVVMNQTKLLKIYGDKFVSGVEVLAESNKMDLAVDGVFVEIGLTPNSEFNPDIQRNQLNEIMVNCRNETNLAGLFACGDVTDVAQKQIIVACGEGAKAALSAQQYLNRLKI